MVSSLLIVAVICYDLWLIVKEMQGSVIDKLVIGNERMCLSCLKGIALNVCLATHSLIVRFISLTVHIYHRAKQNSLGVCFNQFAT